MIAVDGTLPGFVCPRCHGALTRADAAFACGACDAVYPVVLGIPDFRVAPDPWIGIEDDREKARRVAALVAQQPFEQAVRTYWDITPDTPRRLAERFIDHVLSAEGRANEWLDWLDRNEAQPPSGPWLEVGCGSGDLVAAGSARGVTVVGVDVALRWLVVAARRAALAHRSHLLVCANGEHLPFPPGSFARVVSVGTLEHCRDAERCVAEGRRVLRAGGVMRVRTVNRYSVLAEPHVGVWGVGLVPRRWADRYVRWRSGQRYQHHRPLSARELARGFRRAGFSGVRVAAAALLPRERARLRGVTLAVAPVYERLRGSGAAGALLRWVAPLLDARGVAA